MFKLTNEEEKHESPSLIYLRSEIVYYNEEVTSSYAIFQLAKKVNVFATIICVVGGLFGHCLIIMVYSQKRFRTNSNCVYLLCLAINDCLFLIAHLIEDTLRSYKEVYIRDSSSTNEISDFNQFILWINLTDRYNLSCKLVNYFRYVLRFTSSYILVVFTIQRYYIVSRPLSNKFKSHRSAWYTCLSIVGISCIANIWNLLIFEIDQNNKDASCDVASKWFNDYFYVPAIYILIDIFIPICILLVCNLLIFIQLKNSNVKRKNELRINRPINRKKISTKTKKTAISTSLIDLRPVEKKNKKNMSQTSFLSNLNENQLAIKHRSSILIASSKTFIKPFYRNVNSLANNRSTKLSDSRNTTINLLVISIVFVLLNLPFLIVWFMLWYKMAYTKIDLGKRDYQFVALQISEIFHVLNYGILFYLYCALGNKFRNQLKNLTRPSNSKNARVEFYFS